MTDLYSDSNGSKKKFLIPLLVLLLCTVSLTGAGFAYSSTVTNTDDTIIVEGVTLDLLDSNDAAVDDAMYNFRIAYSTDVTNGKAVKTNSYGFKTVENVQSVVTVDSTNTLDTFDDGFYVNTMYAEGTTAAYASAGYHTALSGITAATLKAAAESTTDTQGVSKLGDEYSLVVVNASGISVDLGVTGTYASAPSLGSGVTGLYLVVTGTIAAGTGTTPTAATTVSTVISLIPGSPTSTAVSGTIASFAGDQAAETELTVQAYVICSDYCSATKPTVQDTDFGLTLTFTATNNA